MSDKYVQANGINIHYEEFGSGTPLIALHGGTGTIEEWRALAPSFTSQFHIYALDSRGHGKTDNPLGKLSYHTMADDVAAFIKVLNIPRPLVCGYSDGGQIALEIAMRYPGLARALVVGATWYNVPENLTSIGYRKNFHILSKSGRLIMAMTRNTGNPCFCKFPNCGSPRSITVNRTSNGLLIPSLFSSATVMA
jgi:pimeloyl-ACP methyl ester carboxylesterase